MAKRVLNILERLSKDDIERFIKEIGNALLTETSHNFNDYGPIRIAEAAELSFVNYYNKAQELPAIALIEVVLAANRNYNKHVLPNIQRIKKDYPAFKSFSDLKHKIIELGQEGFYKFWGPRDKKKFQTLINIVDSIDILKIKYPNLNDYQILNKWANGVNLLEYKDDPIGKHYNVAIATIQHLRMVFGANTVKPDQRVIEVLQNKFGLTGINQLNSILYIEQMSAITGMPTLLLDQFFVLYGSGYYNRNSNIKEQQLELTTAMRIAFKLKQLNVANETIAQATNIDLQEIINM